MHPFRRDRGLSEAVRIRIGFERAGFGRVAMIIASAPLWE